MNWSELKTDVINNGPRRVTKSKGLNIVIPAVISGLLFLLLGFVLGINYRQEPMVQLESPLAKQEKLENKAVSTEKESRVKPGRKTMLEDIEEPAIRGRKNAATEVQEPIAPPPPPGPGDIVPLAPIDYYSMRVGNEGSLEGLHLKIRQIIDSGKMLVEIQDRREGVHSKVIMMKCRTDGLVDGDHTAAPSQELSRIRKSRFKVTGTETYQTALGSKTVFVLEIVK